MGVWQGIYEAHLGIVERKDREKELQQAREDRARERQEDRDDANSRFNRDFMSKRMEALYPLLAEADLQRKRAQTVTSEAQAFYSRVKGLEDDPRVQAFLSQPAAAAQVEIELRNIESKKAGDGFNIPFSGAALLEVLNPPNTDVGTFGINLEELEGLDLTDDRKFYETLSQAASGARPREFTGLVRPAASYTPNSENLEETRRVFEQGVIERAIQTQKSLDVRSEEWVNRQRQIEGYGKNPADTATLNEMFARPVLADILTVDSPYLQGAAEAPEFSRYVGDANNINKLRQGIESPDTTEAEKQDARELLKTVYGLDQ